MTAKSPPKTLDTETRSMWREINKTHELNYEQMLVLKTALEQYQLYHRARAELEKDGLSVPTPSGIKAHPAAGIMKSARDGFLLAWKQLGIALEVKGVGRPTDSRELKWRKRLNLVATGQSSS